MPFIDIHAHHIKPGADICIMNHFVQQFDETKADLGNISVGLHPWHVDDNYEANIEKLEKLAGSKTIMAIGEAGLDKIKGPEISLQTRAFEEQIKIAERSKRPLIIHAVRSYSEIIGLFNKYRPSAGWIVHGFTGNAQIARQLAEKGIWLSFGKSLFEGHQKTVDAFRDMPVDRLFLETDNSAGLSINDMYKKAAEIKNLEIRLLKESIHHNFRKLFEF